jgi:hypothetical protein
MQGNILQGVHLSVVCIDIFYLQHNLRFSQHMLYTPAVN